MSPHTEPTAPGSSDPLGIVAGAGSLPVLLARKHHGGRPVHVIGVVAEVAPELRPLAERYASIGPGVLGGIFERLRAWDVREVALLGSVTKTTVLDPGNFDDVGLAVVSSLRDASDHALLGAVVEAFVGQGFTVRDQRDHLAELVVSAAVLAGAELDASAQSDIDLALETARQVAAAGIGQTVVLKQGVTVAVEAIEGTDEAVRRGGSLGGEGVVVAKAAHPNHDFRCDVPTVGPDTLEVLAEVGARALVLEAGRAFLMERDACLSQARKSGISVLAC